MNSAFSFLYGRPCKKGWIDLRKADYRRATVIITGRVFERERTDEFGKAKVNAMEGCRVYALHSRKKRSDHHQIINVTMKPGLGNLFERPVGRCLCVPVIGQQVMQDSLRSHAKTEKQQGKCCEKTSYVISVFQ